MAHDILVGFKFQSLASTSTIHIYLYNPYLLKNSCLNNHYSFHITLKNQHYILQQLAKLILAYDVVESMKFKELIDLTHH
jgi:hypothetical protein